ncbi:MAG: carbamoyltransferase HypF [Actinobacteria bacterium]|nr:carbamoyltransferase HypF [Actinomycetota bacterium]
MSDTYSINIKGIVQGVGFRPFIWRLFNELGIKGFVTNTTEGVYIELNAKNRSEVASICSSIVMKKPGPSLIEEITFEKTGKKTFKDFSISESLESGQRFQLISPDIATCKSCQADIYRYRDKRRYFYPFTNCTNCGPRFTIIEKMPYDRKNTTMRKFRMCPECGTEYRNPSDRRFHAQPNACSECGPVLFLTDNSGKILDKKNPLKKASGLLKNGKIIGIKSLGGFQIACSALSGAAVKKLRARKNRPFKPFAVMFKDIGMVKKYLEVSRQQESSLKSSAAPIVLLRKKVQSFTGLPEIASLAEQVSFYNKYEGAMLPYTPLHHLLFSLTDFPLVMTSGNVSEEPIASLNDEAIEKLNNICDYFLINDRDIFSKYDDSVLKISSGRQMLMRRARGFAPYPVKLDINIGNRAVFAAGANEKNTFCLLTKNYAILSQHIGDLENPESLDFYSFTFKNYLDLFGIDKIDLVAYDSHPDYGSTRFAQDNFKKTKKINIQHHSAHIAAVAAENHLFKTGNMQNTGSNKTSNAVLGFSWDGTGYGDDGKIWGSEILVMQDNFKTGQNLPPDFKRIGHLRQKILPGGDAAIKKPYRMAFVYLYEIFKKEKNNNNIDFESYFFKHFPFYKNIISSTETNIIKSQIETGFNSPLTTSMGRFFDAVSSVLNLTHTASYEGEAAVHLEMAAAEKVQGYYKINITSVVNGSGGTSGGAAPEKNNCEKTGIDFPSFEIDDFSIFSQIAGDIGKKIPAPVIAAKFHNTLARIILIISLNVRNLTKINMIALSGGVFQNSFLFEKALKALKRHKFEVYSNYRVPVNDGGISLGQAYMAAMHLIMGDK